MTNDDGTVRADSPSTSYYSTPARHGLIQQLIHLSQFGDGLPIVQGVAGSGKTTLFTQLPSHLHDMAHVASLSVDEDYALAALFQGICEGLSVSCAGSPGLGESMVNLRHFSQMLVKDQKTAIVLLDDAHNLDEQALGAILSLMQASSDPVFGIRFVFFSLPGLDGRVDQLGVVDIAVYDFDVPPFSLSDLEGFLTFTQRCSDNAQANTLAQQVWPKTGGVVGQIIPLIRHVESSDTGGKKLGGLPFWHLVLLVVLVALLFWVWLAWDGRQAQPIDQEVPSPLGLLHQPELERVEGDPVGHEESNMAPRAEVGSHIIGSDLKEGGGGIATRMREISASFSGGTVSSSEVLVSELEEDNASGAPPMNTAVLSEDISPKSEAHIASLEKGGNVQRGSVLKQEAKVNSQAKVVSQVEVISQVEVAVLPSEPPTSLPVGAELPSKPEPVSSVPPEKLPLAGSLPPEASRLLSGDEQYLLERSDEAYTLQILAAASENSLKDYIGQQSNREKLRLYRKLRSGKPWYTIVEGVYSSRSEAKAAIQQLPKNQKDTGPWPRQLSVIKREIRAFGDS